MHTALGKPITMINFVYMALEKTDILKIAQLARLQLRDDEVQGYTQQLSGILDFVNQMNAVDTEAIAPLAHPLDISARLRDDMVTEQDQRAAFQAIAPAVEAGLYLVTKVID